ncbi:MAG: tetratricopeptide repeat protein [Casimicrobium sp.]
MIKNSLLHTFAFFFGLFVASVANAADTPSTPVETAKLSAYEEGSAAIKRKDWAAAAKHFEAAVAAAPKNADAHNMLGYSYRWLGKHKEAFASYDRAFAIDPGHRGAHEYAGVAHLKQKNIEKARWHLSQLEKICAKQCEEYKDLERAVGEYTKAKG